MSTRNCQNYPPHNGDGLEREESRIADLVVDDTVKDFLFVVAGEWRLADEHLKDEDAETPPVDGSGVGRLCQHLWRQELGRAAESARPVAETHAFFAQTKVGYFDVAFRVQQQIIQLQISAQTRNGTIRLQFVGGDLALAKKKKFLSIVSTCK